MTSAKLIKRHSKVSGSNIAGCNAIDKIHVSLLTIATFLCQLQENLRVCGSLNFSSSCFMVCDSHIKIISSRIVVCEESPILYYEIMFIY